MNQQTRKRIKTIEQVRNTIRELYQKGDGIEYKKLVAVISLQSNVSERKSKEYVNLLINSGEFILEEGFVILNNELKGDLNKE